jgi:arginine N-succinyltransferase
MFVFHEVRPSDLDELERLAAELDTLNLPADRDRLEQIVAKSRASFGGEYEDLKEREYVFVLRDLSADKLVGTCMIIAQHGTYERPAVYFNVREEQKYSDTLDKFFNHEVLQLEFDYHGPTEIGGLILHPDYRDHRLKLGKLLSYIRFLYIGMHREWFRDRIVADLLPPLREEGGSDLWDGLGRHFTDMPYREADRLSRQNVEFVRSLFPTTPIYTALLPEKARNKIGVVGDATKPAAEMLREIGFTYDERIDPFDGGPTFAVQTDFCQPVQRTREVTFAGQLDEEDDQEGQALFGYEYGAHRVRFRAAFGEYKHTPSGVFVRSPVLRKLRVTEGEKLGFLPLSGPGLEELYAPVDSQPD